MLVLSLGARFLFQGDGEKVVVSRKEKREISRSDTALPLGTESQWNLHAAMVVTQTIQNSIT